MNLSIFQAAEANRAEPFLIDGDRIITLAEAAATARSALNWLLCRGVEPERELVRPVAIVADNDAPTVFMLLALIGAGIPFVLLHPRWSQAERQRFVAGTPIRFVVDPRWHTGRLAMAEPIDDLHDDERPLCVVPTSGTSGQPKGVVLSRRAFVAAAEASARNLGFFDTDRWLLQLPLAHVGGFSILTRCLLARRTVVLARGLRGAALLDCIERQRISLLSLVPTQLGELMALEPPPAAPESLRAVLVGGASANPSLLRRAADIGWPVLATYGLTEACSQVCTQRYGTRDPDAHGVGPALRGIEVRVVDGAIEVRGPTLLSGYFPQHAAPVLSADGWFRTRDVGRLDERGELWVLGRSDETIITGGENVQPFEVEAALENHPSILRACVFGVPDETWGLRVAAALIVDPAKSVGMRELEAFFEQQLASFKRPRAVAFLSRFPELPNGKLDRARIRELAAALLEPIP